MSSLASPIPVQSAPSKAQLAVAYSVCRGITRSAAKNFYYAFLVLPEAKRQALYAVYAFMRRCDDYADDMSMTAHERRQKLGLWVEAFHNAQAGQPTDDPILLALLDAVRCYQIPTALLDQLAYGTAMDIEDTVAGVALEKRNFALSAQYKTFDDLYLYCYRVASVVGLVCIRIFGYRDVEAERLAERCGLAFQLTNILRDVKEDADMGRVYIPEEDLQKFCVSADDLRTGKNFERIRPMLAEEARRAQEFYRAADKLIPLIDEDSQPALWTLVAIYRRLLEKMAQRNFEVFSVRVRVTTREKLTILGKGFWKRIT